MYYFYITKSLINQSIMNKKLLVLGLIAGLAFIGCQTETVSDQVQTEELSISKEKTKTEITTKIHNPDWMIAIHNPDWMIAIHNPDWMLEGYASCEGLEEYTGSESLSVPHSAEPRLFGGITKLKNLSVGGMLSICGGLDVEGSARIHNSGELTVVGMMMVGSNEQPQDLIINNKSHLNMNGTLIVTGNLILNRGATLEFNNDLEHNNLIVEGEIIRDDYSFLSGQYNDHSEHEHTH